MESCSSNHLVGIAALKDVDKLDIAAANKARSEALLASLAAHRSVKAVEKGAIIGSPFCEDVLTNDTSRLIRLED
jgi:hypothetical protein